VPWLSSIFHSVTSATHQPAGEANRVITSYVRVWATSDWQPHTRNTEKTICKAKLLMQVAFNVLNQPPARSLPVGCIEGLERNYLFGV
jgi:hypothetical protein